MSLTKYVALLRGVNVGGNNKIDMRALKAAFERRGFQKVVTYINSGNLVFEGDLDELSAKAACEELIRAEFNLDIGAGIIPAAELTEVLRHAPDWWGSDPDAKHNAIFVIPPMTAAEICARVDETRPECERTGYYGRVVFWTAPPDTYSPERLSKLVKGKAMRDAITIRNANTVKKLAELAEKG